MWETHIIHIATKPREELMMMKMQRVVLLLVVALFALTALAPVHADPREIENAE